ncbi:hypothetical protein HZ326_21820 [Fusarium oxysporum f. sp. albedinis]|nr:hypothetical protein HZ326_21820 [Fusarium oxysporum f. sp. albedinis]
MPSRDFRHFNPFEPLTCRRLPPFASFSTWYQSSQNLSFLALSTPMSHRGSHHNTDHESNFGVQCIGWLYGNSSPFCVNARHPCSRYAW